MNIAKELSYALSQSPITKKKIAKQKMLTFPTVKMALTDPNRCRFDTVADVADALGYEIVLRKRDKEVKQ